MRYTPALPPQQPQRRLAVPHRGAPRTDNFTQDKLRTGLTAGRYVISEGTAYFEFRHSTVLGYPNFTFQDFQLLVSSTKRQRLFNERFRRPPVLPLNYTYEPFLPGSFDLSFDV